jgi:hypothetical protein
LSRHDSVASPPKRRPRYLFPMALAGVFMCAGLLGTYLPASADTFSHLPTIDLYPTINYATGNDEYGSPGGPDPNNNYGFLNPAFAGNCPGCAAGGTRPGKFDLNAVITIPLFKGLNFQYEHDRAAGIDTTIGRVPAQISNGSHLLANPAGGFIYPKTSNDIADTFRLNYTGIKGVGVTLATFYRFRHDNTATNDPLNLAPADWHQQTLTLSYTAPAIAALNGLTLGVSGTGVYNRHHASPAGIAGEAAAGLADNDGKTRYGVNYGVNAHLPINHGFAIYGSTSYGGFDYFDNNPIFYYVIDDVGIYKKFNDVLSLTADLNNLTQENRGGFPFAFPNTIHRIYFAIALDIHLAPK